MSKTYDVTAAGHICLDIIPQIPDTGIRDISALFKPGRLIHVTAAKISTGGPVSNTGIALKKLGLNVTFMARVGNDEFGKLIIQLLRQQGHTEGVSISDSDRTSYTIAIAPPGIDRIFLHDPGANDSFSSADLDAALIARSKLFHFGYPPIMRTCYQNRGEELLKIFQIARSAGVVTSLDMALPDPTSESGKVPWREILERLLPSVDIFLPSIEEVFFMLEPARYFQVKARAATKDVVDFIAPADFARLGRQCLAMGAKIIVLKAAHRGMYLLTAPRERLARLSTLPGDLDNWSQRELWCPAFRVEQIASATGSGDSAIAGFLAAYLRGHSIESTLKFANCVGYQNLHELDAVSGIHDWEYTCSLVNQKNLTMIDIGLPENDWRWDAAVELWIGKEDRRLK
ncbi:MAG: carbohydrate kinase family protein [candidate division KSB1 bacterium]|nr:carbohydrate kinase family protein [candidate division KSB1 bacterium]MDZ7340442.1 carbohydrate kinase family protein [candidate division KSB1 bacterium]